MKKILLIIIALFTFVLSAISQEYHFIYIRLDASMDYSTVTIKLNALTSDIEKNKGKFVVLFSNTSPKMVATTTSDVQEITKEFSTTSFMTIELNEELDAWLNILENNEICSMVNGKIALSNNVSSVAFNMFVGDEFVEAGMQNHLLAKFLYASDLHNSNININYYNSSQLTEDITRFSEIYQKNNLLIQLK